MAKSKSSSEAQDADLKAQGMPTFSDPPPPVSEPPGALASLFSNGVNFVRGLDRGFSQNIGAMAGSSPLDLAKHIGSGLIEPFRVVHDTATGQMDPRDMGPGTDRAIGMGIDIGTAAAGLPGEPGALGMFAGRGSRTFPHDALQAARQTVVERKGPYYYLSDARHDDALQRDIWKEHGIGITRDKHEPFYEIDDSASIYKGKPEPPNRPSRGDFRDPETGLVDDQAYGDAFTAWDAARKAQASGPLTLKDVLDHPELYKAYPDLADTEVMFDPGMKEYGWYDRNNNRIGLNPSFDRKRQHETVLHEAQHAIQAREGWQGGANMETGKSIANVARNNLNVTEGMMEFADGFRNGLTAKDMQKWIAKGNATGSLGDLQTVEDIIRKNHGDANAAYDVVNGMYQEMMRVANDRRDPFQNYQRVEGEINARNTGNTPQWFGGQSPQGRRTLTPEQRRGHFWKDTEDYQYSPRFLPKGNSATDLDYAEGGMVNHGSRDNLINYLALGGRPKKPKGALLPTDRIEIGDRPGMISERLPTAVKASENPYTSYLKVGVDEMRQDPEMFAKNISLLRNPNYYPMVRDEVRRDGTDEDVLNDFLGTAKSNLLFLHDKMPEGLRQRSSLWYDGANRIARERAAKFGLPVESTAGNFAALSPQKDWFQNVDLGDRVLDIYHNGIQPGSNHFFNSEMAATARALFGKDPNAETIINKLKGTRLSDLDNPTDKALWVRTYDETYNPRDYRIVSPEGDFGDYATNADGTRRKVAWGSLGEIGKAISSIEANGDPARLSQLMGERHKVRSFYNNIVAPDSNLGALTGDTHHVGASMLMPMSGSSIPVVHNFKNSLAKKDQPEDWQSAAGSTKTGMQGTYGIFKDAGALAALDRGLIPRQMQSITWEAVRGLISAVAKRDPALANEIHTTWRLYAAGRIPLAKAQERIYDLAGGIDAPAWAGGTSNVDFDD